MLGRVVQLGLTFISTMLVARYLGPSENGRMLYAYSYIQLFIPLCAAGMNDIVVKELVDNRDENDEILGSMIGIRLFFSIISMIASVSLVTFFNQDGDYTAVALLQCFALMFQSFESIMYFFQAHLLSRKSGITIALAFIITTIYRISGIMIGKDILWFAFAYSLDYIVMAVIYLYIYFRDGHRFRFSFAMARRLLSKSYYYIFAGILVVIYGKVTDTILLGRMVDDAAVGYYGAATTLCNAWPFILVAIIDSASPMIIDLYGSDKDAFYHKLKQLYAAIFYISMIVGILMCLLARLVIMILYGQEYLPAVLPLRIVVWNSAFSYFGVSRTIWMQCRNRTRYEIYISLFGAVINILLNYLLIGRYGIVGAAIANTLTQFLTNFVFIYLMKQTRENAKLILDAVMLKGVLHKEVYPNVQE